MTDAARQSLEEPHVAHGRRERDVAEALAANLRLRHLDAAFVADHASVLHALYELPQRHSQSVIGPKIFAQNKPSRSGLNVR